MLRSIALAALFAAASYDVGPFPKDHPERAFAELKVRDASGSPLRRPRENWEEARRKLSTDAEWQSWLKQRRAELDEWMEHRQDHVEWVAGWWHDFVNPKDGGFLTWTPEEPGPGTPEKVRAAWVFGFRSRHTDKVLEAARMFRATNEQKYAVWASKQLDFYAENWSKWPVQTAKSKSRLMHQSLDDANVLVRLVNAARLLDATKEQRERWISKLFRPQAGLLDETFQRIHNIACWQRSAMAQAALYADDEELWKRAVDGPYGIRKQIEHGVTSEYLWFEQSLGYNSYVVSALLPLFTMASLDGRGAELTQEMHAIENMMLAPIALRFPTGQLPNPADATGGLPQVPSGRTLAAAYRVFPTTLGLAAAAKERSWDTLIDPPEPAAAGALPEVTARDWSSSRMAVLRSGEWQVYVHYGQLNASHAQAEALNFEAFYGDTDVTHDPGTVGYGSPLHTGFYRTGVAHNVPLFNGQGQARWDPGEMVKFAPDSIIVRQPRYRPGVEATRELHIDGTKLIDRATITAAESGRLGLMLHLQGKIALPDSARTAEPVKLPYFENTRAVEGPATFLVSMKNRTIRITVAATSPFTITAGDTPDVPPHRRDSLYLETAGTTATFTTTMEAP